MKQPNNNSNEIINEFKEEEDLVSEENNIELENLDLNNLLTFGFNFDMLKLIIINLIRNQHKINFQITELKLDKINKEKRADELESMIIDLKILKEDSNQIKKDLQEQKKKLTSKEYQKEIASIIKEKGYLLQSLGNLNKNEGMNKNKKNLIHFKDLLNKDKSNKTQDNLDSNLLNNLQKELSYNTERFENLKNEMISEINRQINEVKSKFEEVKSKMISNEKEFILMKKTIKNMEEKMDIKFTQDMPKLIEKIYYSKITSIDSKVMQMEDKFQNNLNQFKEIIQKNIFDLQKNIQIKNEELDKKFDEINNNDKNILEKVNLINEKFKDYLTLKDYKQYKLEIEGKIIYENKQVSIEVANLGNTITYLKNDITDFLSDKTDHNNLNNLMKKFEAISAITYKNQEIKEEFEKEKKRLQNFDPKKYVYLDLYEEFKNNISKLVSSFQKDFQDIKNELADLNSKNLGSKASIRDLKNLEDNLLQKIDELFNIIKEKFAEKNMVIKNNKIVELKIKNIIDDYKKNEKSDTWILSKKPIGHLCASCEAYLGDFKDSSTNTKYIPWNKYPTKDPINKLYRVGAGFSKMLQMVNPDSHRNKTNKTKNSSVNEIIPPNGKNEPEEETNSNITKDKILINNSINYENNSGIQMDNEINVNKLKLPNLLKVNNLKKNLTFTNFYNNENSEDIIKKNQINNNTRLKFTNVIVNNMNKHKKLNIKKVNNIEIEKDEIIHLPNSPQLARKMFPDEEQKGPKIMKVIKKGSNENRNRKRIALKDKIIN